MYATPVLLTVCCVAVSASGSFVEEQEIVEEEESIHGSFVSLLQRVSTLRSPCQCLQWKTTYQRDNITCGETNEFFLASHQTMLGKDIGALQAGLGQEFCTNFFQTLEDSYCINLNMGADDGQWCYVSSECSSLNGGTHVGGAVSWKRCAAGQDNLLRDYTPEMLASLASSAHLDLGLLHKMSYPLSKQHQWKDVSGFWGVGVDSLDTVPSPLAGHSVQEARDFLAPRWGAAGAVTNPTLRAELQAIVDSDTPFSFDTADDQHPPHIIVKGWRVYLVLGDLTCLSKCAPR